MRAMVALCLLLASSAHADGLDAEKFVPATGAEGGFTREHPAVPSHLGWSFGLFLNGADDQVVVRDDVNDVVLAKPLDTGFTADLVGSLGLIGRFELGLHLPVHLIYDGDPAGELNASAGIGDLRLVPKVRLLATGSLDRHVMLGIAVPVSLPTGNDDALRGAGGVTIGPSLLFAAHISKLGLGFDVGYRYRSQHPVGLPWADGVAFGPWVSIGITDSFALRGELIAEKLVGADVTNATFPVEVLGGFEFRRGGLGIYGGASFGLSDGVGAPDFRIIGGVRYRKNTPDRQGFRDSDGDGVLDKDDRCPNEAEDRDGFHDEDGCPEPDNDHDGIPDEEDECPDLSGERDRRGCPRKTYVTITEGRMVIIGKVQFQTGSATIDKNSEPLLDQIAQALDANQQVRKLRIEGHTDNVGDKGANQKLSEQRASAVKDALIKRGVARGRLDTKGYGEDKPMAPNSSAGGRQKNRRVEFVIVESRR